MLPYLALLHETEFHQLMRKGQLHALPAARFVPTADALQIAPWLTALPQNTDTRWVIVGCTHNQLPLTLEATDFNHPIPLTEEQARVLQPPFQAVLDEQGNWLKDLWKRLRQALWIGANAPHGLIVVPRWGSSRPEKEPYLDSAAVSYIRPEQVLDPAAWTAAVPDVADDDQAIIIRLSTPVADRIPISAANVYPVGALSERGEFLLTNQSGYRSEQVHTNYAKLIQPILEFRRTADAVATAERLASTVPLKAVDKKKFGALQQHIEHAFARKQSANNQVDNFWDALLQYERTGEGAESIPQTQRGYLHDLGRIIKEFYRAEKSRNKFTDSDYNAARQELTAWGVVMNESLLDADASQIFKPKSGVQSLIQNINHRTDETEINSLAVGYLFLRLRDRTGNQEIDLTPEFLDELQQDVRSSKLEKEMALALFALGLMEPSHRFLAVFRHKSSEWLGTAATPPANTKQTARKSDIRPSRSKVAADTPLREGVVRDRKSKSATAKRSESQSEMNPSAAAIQLEPNLFNQAADANTGASFSVGSTIDLTYKSQ